MNHICLVRLVVLKRPAFQSRKYGMPTPWFIFVNIYSLFEIQTWAQFCCKMWGDSLVWNQYSHRVYAEVSFYIYWFPILFFRCVLRATLITLLSLQMIYILIYLNLLLNTVLQFSLFPLISEVNKHNNIAEHISWVLSELSVGVHKMLNCIGRTCISLLQWNISVFIHFISVGYSAIRCFVQVA